MVQGLFSRSDVPRYQALPGNALDERLCLVPLDGRQSLQAVRSQAEPGNEEHTCLFLLQKFRQREG